MRYTLLSDGSSDKTLLNIIRWLLDDLYPKMPCEESFADFRNLKNPPRAGNIIERIKRASEYYPFDILFYHRDAETTEKTIVKKRKEEVFAGIGPEPDPKIVCVVPITMMETWLLIDRDAIKKAAGNRNYAGDVDLPGLSSLESVKNPKARLHHILETTSGLKGRRLKTFNVHRAVHLVAENIRDYGLLRQLFAFNEFEKDLKAAVDMFLGNN